MDLPNNRFKSDMAIHARARLIFLIDQDVINENGMVDDERNLIKQGKWSVEKITHFNGAPNHVCVVEDMDDELIATLSPNNGMRNGMENVVNDQNVQPGHISPINAGVDIGYNYGLVPTPVQGVVQRKKAKVKCEIVLESGKKPKMKMFLIKPGFTFENLILKCQKAVKSDRDLQFTLRDQPHVVIGNNDEFLHYCVNPEPDDAGYNAYLKVRVKGVSNDGTSDGTNYGIDDYPVNGGFMRKQMAFTFSILTQNRKNVIVA